MIDMASCLVMDCAISGGLVWLLVSLSLSLWANARRMSMSFHFQCQLLLSLLFFLLWLSCLPLKQPDNCQADDIGWFTHRMGISLAEC